MIKLAKLRADSLDAKAVERRVFALAGLVRDRLTGWASRAASIIEAQAVIVDGKVEEGSLWRAMNSEMRKLQTEVGSLDLERALTELEAEDSADEEAKTDTAP